MIRALPAAPRPTPPGGPPDPAVLLARAVPLVWAPVLTGALLVAGCDGAPVGPDADRALAEAVTTITAADVAEVVGVIAHDSMGGRGTPSPGLEKAASYLADRFAALGLQPAGTDGYLQRFDFTYPVRDTGSIVLELVDGSGPGLVHGRDYLFLASNPERGDARGPLFWGGDAATHDLASLGVTGGVVLYDLPVSDYDLEAMAETTEASRVVVMGGGVAVGYVVGPDFTEDDMARAVARTERRSRRIPEFWIREDAANALLAAAGQDLTTLRAGAPQALGDSLRARGLLQDVTVFPPNVVAVLPGSGRADEYVAVTAHFDHLGIVLPNAEGDSIANGADDNGSGTAAVVEIAEAVAALETPPDRSILFLLVGGEEYGLIGSAHFGGHPTVPMADIVANINLDMVGRNDPGHVFGIGAAYSSLGVMADSLAGSHEALGLDVVSDPVIDGTGFFRSDQLVFACRGVPALFLHAGLHADYHSVDDELERLDTAKVARVAALAFYLTHAVAGMDDRPEWTDSGRAALEGKNRCR